MTVVRFSKFFVDIDQIARNGSPWYAMLSSQNWWFCPSINSSSHTQSRNQRTDFWENYTHVNICCRRYKTIVSLFHCRTMCFNGDIAFRQTIVSLIQ